MNNEANEDGMNNETNEDVHDDEDVVDTEDVEVHPHPETCKKSKGRRLTQNAELDTLPQGTTIKVKVNLVGEAKRYTQFTSRLSTIAKLIVPLSYFDWRYVPKELKKEIIRQLEVVFDWGDDPMVPKYILKHCGKVLHYWGVEMKSYMMLHYKMCLLQ